MGRADKYWKEVCGKIYLNFYRDKRGRIRPITSKSQRTQEVRKNGKLVTIFGAFREKEDADDWARIMHGEVKENNGWYEVYAPYVH